MREAIQKAIEGGYEISLENKPCPCHDDPRCINASKGYSQDQILLDPLFWQALGKAMRWPSQTIVSTNGRAEAITSDNEPWFDAWHGFIDHLAEGEDTESFFKDLLP